MRWSLVIIPTINYTHYQSTHFSSLLLVRDERSTIKLARQHTARKVTFQDEDGDEETIQLVTTLRQDALKGLISKESPVGKALMGKRVGDTVRIQVNENYAYDVTILSIEKTGEDPDIPISTF